MRNDDDYDYEHEAEVPESLSPAAVLIVTLGILAIIALLVYPEARP